ncbi:PAS domain-containing hybrid sensor histidine kinase/response regulator [Luteimonas sp BLCC-B24]|uniref:hybrid sensor histidine kinase/response regulator n=1 Tax=Luteimonas sp. BLCC-B24 TaxID=3025317 RepID=UPI00234CD08A|nr:PAS domain-containing hybrid sensor histidine kinase/response regulator [Luteimonas sp. BLCC-B24]MDC7807087.1 PAS domain-containing hybrid sensor histidine kinase/response regulator [Luteimonas sp. BLCC-B24]
MLPGWVLLLVSLGYAALLFGVAWYGDRRALYTDRPWLRSAVYSLALAVYCSSWTFYGAVGTAVRQGVGYLPIYIGPLLLLLFGWRILERLALIAQSQNTVSIADFIASRYGRSQRLAAMVALIALVAAVPYLALQYKAVAISLGVLGGPDDPVTPFGDPAFYVAALMALFAILFGTRTVDATEHRPGMMLAVALESLVKLVALVAVGVFAVAWLGRNALPLADATHALIAHAPPSSFAVQCLLAFAAIICLPRQFHVAVVECGDVRDIRRARWLFGGYLVVICLMVLPIASAGVALFGREGPVAPDSFVLALPMADNADLLALFAYIGGFSAATGMVIVSSVALATMISNDLVMPLLLRRGYAERHGGNVASTVLWVRRGAIVGLAALAYIYYRTSGNETTLAAFGLMAFVAVAQFAPALIGGLYWRGASRRGVEVGLLLGFCVWGYTLLLPKLTESGLLDPAWMVDGPLGLGWLRPRALFGLGGWDPLTHGTFWSLLFNVGALLLVSARWRPTLDERLRAAPFLDPYAERRTFAAEDWNGNVSIGDLLTLTGRIVGDRTARRVFDEYAVTVDRPLVLNAAADRTWLQFTERQLAAAVGASSARLLMTSALKGSGMEVDEVVAMLDEAGQELRFNREVLSSTLENIDHGVSVVDRTMRLVAWNRSYQRLFGYPDNMLYVGRPVADLIRYNAERGELGPRDAIDIDTEIDKRIAYMRAGSPHVSERVLGNGQVIELRGQPLPGGGYATSYSDVTDYKRAERELMEINETLEQRVTERTREAESAQESRSRFLTAVSHDVLQPLNAARLFTSALRESQDIADQKHFAERIDTSLRAAEELLDGLLDVSRLDAGALKPEITDFDAAELLRQLAGQYAPMAQARQIEIRLHAPPTPVRSDRRLLRRVLQNFLANALRYTRSGRIVLAARRRGDTIALQVWDTGPGIPEHHMSQIYDEFHRYEQTFDWDGRGLGLGLSICQRISRLLGHTLDARSRVGQGSMFAITVPRSSQAILPVAPPAAPLQDESLRGLRVLCVDNDDDILAGMRALLRRWGVEPLCAKTIDEAIERMDEAPDVLLVDYHLHDRHDGLDTLDMLRGMAPEVPGALLTADGSDTLKQAARIRGYRVLTKPVKPASMRAFLAAQRAGRRPRPASR